MGILRTLLALCVAVFHSYTIAGFHFTGGRVAVQCFYIISGFYMALILNEKYVGGIQAYTAFIKNRLLRIYPAYVVVLILSFAVSVFALLCFENPLYLGYYVPHWEKTGIAAKILFVLSNFFLLGQDALFFLKLDLLNGGALSFTHDTFMERPQLLLNGFTLVPQAWTLSIEIMFYLLAPFIVRKKWFWQLGIVALSLGLRLYLVKVMNWKFDPWTYRFFPNEIAFFVAGSLLYHLHKIIDAGKYAKQMGLFFFVLIIASIIFYDRFEYDKDIKCWYFYLLFSAALPFIFSFSKNSKTDRFIGELSYPIYLIHHLVMILLRQYYWKHMSELPWFGVSVIAITIPAAMLIHFAVIRPVERRREKNALALKVLKS